MRRIRTSLPGPAPSQAKSVVFARDSATCGGGAQSLCLGYGLVLLQPAPQLLLDEKHA